MKNQKKRARMIAIVAASLAGLAAAFVVVWYWVIPGQESLANTVERAQVVAKIEHSPGAGAAVLEERLRHTLMPGDRGRLELAEGKLYLSSLKYATAIKILERARQDGADKLEVENDLARAYKSVRNYAMARHYYQRLVDYYSSDARAQTVENENRKSYFRGKLAVIPK